MSIINYVKSLVRTIGKEDILEDIRITKKEISAKLIPLFTDADNYFKVHKLRSDEAIYLNSSFMGAVGQREKYKNMFEYINRKLPNILANLDVLANELDKSLETKLVTNVVTYRKAMLLKSLDLISFMSNYSFRLLTYIYYFESKTTSETEYDDLSMPKPIGQMIIKNIDPYARIIKTVGVDNKKFYAGLSSLKDLPIDQTTIDAMDSMKDENSLNVDTLSLTEFDGNPIYHYRLMVAEWQANRYKLNKETEQYLQLKLLNLKMKNDNKTDPKLEKEIEYISNRINKLQYKIAKAEDSVGGLE